MLEALIFDVDGTLADTEEYHRQAFNESFSREGLDWYWSEDLYHDLLGVTGGRERIKHYIQDYVPNFDAEAKIENLDHYIQQLHIAKTDLYKRKLTEGGIVLRPGVQRLITEAHTHNMRLAIATTTTMENVTKLIECTMGAAVLGWFDVIVAGDMVAKKKPASDVYCAALEKLSLPASKCIAFEDSQLGLKSALGAGITTIITQNHYTRTHAFDDAALVIEHFGEPDYPFKVLQGNAYGHAFLNLAMLEEIYAGLQKSK